MTRPWFTCFASSCGLLLATTLTTTLTLADEPAAPAEKPSAAAADSKAETESAKEEFDPTVIPTGGLPELLAYLKKAEPWQPKMTAALQKDPEARKELLKKYLEVRGKLVTAADQGLALNPSAAERVTLLRTKLNALRSVASGDEAANKEYTALAESLLNDSDESLQSEAYKILFSNRLSKFLRGTSKESAGDIAADLQADLKDEKKRESAMVIAQSATRYLELRGHYELSKNLNQTLLDLAGTVSDDKKSKSLASSAKSNLARLELIGRPAVLSGKMLDGTDFDITSLKGKVVLIDFWATWCGPCIAEMPNVVENYKKYHDRGFEIVGVSIDTDKDKLEKFVQDKSVTWTTLFNPDDATRGFNDPTAKQYFVSGIPATYLVDRSGNVIHINVRGERLGELLGKIFDEK